MAINITLPLLILICGNLTNTYLAYPSWNHLIRLQNKRNTYIIIAILSTVMYLAEKVFPSTFSVVEKLINVANYCVINLGMSLVLIFFIRMIVLHRPTKFEKAISTSAWLCGCLGTSVTEYYENTNPLLYGIGFPTLFYLAIFFVEEPIWSYIHLKRWLKNKHTT